MHVHQTACITELGQILFSASKFVIVIRRGEMKCVWYIVDVCLDLPYPHLSL